jgi:hypothetical protein
MQMKYTYDGNVKGCLILKADENERRELKELVEEKGTGDLAEAEALERLIANSELDWIGEGETGDLTTAPMLGIRDESGKVLSRWAFMDYQVRSFLTDLIETGKAVFIGGTL